MRITTPAVLLAVAAIAPVAHAQDTPPQRRVAGFATANVNRWPRLSYGRLGARVALPIHGRWDVYPALEIEPQLRLSQAFFDLRVLPLGRTGWGSLWYVGGGLAMNGQALRSDLLSGLQWPAGRFRPFVEFHVFNGVNGSADLQAGVALPLS